MNNMRMHYVKTFKMLLITVAAGLCVITVLGYIDLQQMVEKRAQDKFYNQTHDITLQINERVNNFADVLYPTRAYILANKQTSQTQWEDFLLNQDIFNRHDGLSAVGFARYGKGITSEAFSQQISSEHRAKITIKPAGNRQHFAPLVLSVLSNNKNSTSPFGFDLLAEKNRKQTLLESIKSHAPAASNIVKLTNGEDGFLIALPVYGQSNNLFGFVYLVFRTESLFPALLADANQDKIGVKIEDTDSPATALHTNEHWTDQGLSRSDTIKIGQKNWRITYNAPLQNYDDSLLSVLPIALLIGGFMTIVCFLIAVALIRLSAKSS